MSSSQASYRGRVQAQGDDIDIEQKGGYSESWARNNPVTDQDGLSFLASIEGQCNKSQQEQRNTAFNRAKNFVKRASQQGGVGPEMQSHSFQNLKRNRSVNNARVDIEIHSGLTFIPLEKA